MVNTFGSLLGDMGGWMPEPDPSLLEEINETLRQDRIEDAIKTLQYNAFAIDKSITAIEQNAPFARKQAEIQGSPGKFAQPGLGTARLQARDAEIRGLIDQLHAEKGMRGEKGGLTRYEQNDYIALPEELARNDNLDISVRSAPAAPPTVAQPAAPQTVAQQAYAAVAKAGLNPNTLAGVRARAAYEQVAEETLDPEAAAAAAQAVAAQVAQGQNMDTTAAVSAGRAVAEANYSNTYAADMEALGAPKGYAADMAQNELGPDPATIAAQSLAQEALGVTQQAQPTPSELSAMGMMANQAAAEAYSNAISAGATEAEASVAAEVAAQTAAEQAATQVGIDPNSPTVTEAAMNAANTQAVEIGRLAGMTPEVVAAAAQRAVTLAQEGKIGKNTLSQVGLLDPFGLAITAPEVDARRTREAQEIMEQNILAPAPVSSPAPDQNPLGPGRGVPLPVQNPLPAFKGRGDELNAKPDEPPFPFTLLNPPKTQGPSKYSPASRGYSISPAYAGYDDTMNSTAGSNTINSTAGSFGAGFDNTMDDSAGSVGARGAGRLSPGAGRFQFVPAGANNPLGPGRGVTLPVRNPARELQNQHELNIKAPPVPFTLLNPPREPPVPFTLLNPAHSVFFGGVNQAAPAYSAPEQTRVAGTTLGQAMMPGFTSNAPQISAVTPVSPAASFFSAPEPVDSYATIGMPGPVGRGTTVSGVPSGVPGISISPAYAGYDNTINSTAGSFGAGYDDTMNSKAGSFSGTPDPSRGKSAIASMMDVEAQQQARAAINSMMDLEAAVGQQQANQAKAQRAETLSGLTLEDPARTTSSSSSSRGGSRGRSSRGAAPSPNTRTVASFGPDGLVTFSQQADGPDGPDSGCYIATDAVSAGAFSELDKAKAELWCKRALHNHWAGETVRLGYQTLSKRAVANGTASKHYDEFQRFVRYGRGLDKTLKGAVTFYTRMAQFFAVGVINRLKAR